MILCGLGGGFFEAFCNGRDLLVEHAVDGRSAHQMGLRQLAQAVALLAVAEDGGPIEDQGLSPMCRPSSLARRMPARTRSTIKLRSSSAMAPSGRVSIQGRERGPYGKRQAGQAVLGDGTRPC
jgi:hypothetical protein